MNYEMLKKQTNNGWNTWSTKSVLSFSHLPDGFAVNIGLHDGVMTIPLRESLIGRFGHRDEKIFPGARTYDGRYSEMNLKYGETEINVKSAVKNDEQIIYIEPVKHGMEYTKINVEACILWGKDGSLEKKNGRITGKSENRSYEIFSTLPTERPNYSYCLSPSFAVALTEPVVISTVRITVDEALKIIAENKAELDKENEKYGKHTEAFTAMKTCLAWDTIYEEEHDRVCSTVSRLWDIGWGGYVLFDWDTYFAALMASLDNKDLAFLNAIAITDEITESGFIPNFGCAFNCKTRDRSQPPVGAFVCLDIYKRHPEKWFLEHVFEPFMSWNRWFFKNRVWSDGYMCWGSDMFDNIAARDADFGRYDLQSAKYESGLDNSSMFDDQDFNTDNHLMTLADVGLMGLYIQDCKALIEIAEILGRTEVIAELREREEKVESSLMTMWDDEFGMFLNKDMRDGSLSKRMSPTNFYALASNKVTETQKRRMMDEHFYNPEEFWGDYIIPNSPRSDSAYPDQDYWRGRIWAPTNYLTYRAMKIAGLKKECDDFAKKSEELILKEWREHGHVHENYNGTTGEGCDVGNSDKFYHWGGLLAYIAIDNEENK